MSLEEEIRRTQEVLQPLIERPQLKEKFLSKPPFRFLHDIVTNLIKSNGFPRDLYQGDELDSANYKDKDAKLGFLSKLITFVGICHGVPVDVREGKIVAGLEPEKTNRLLQRLAEAAKDDGLDRNEAVRKALAGDKPSPDAVPRLLDRGAKEEEFRTPPPIDASFSDEKQLPLERHRAPSARPSVSRGGQRSSSRRGSREEKKNDDERDDAPQPPTASDGGIASTTSIGLDAQVEACDGSIEYTRTVLEPLLVNKKPKLSDKLLNKPPFRFLHDLIMEVMRSTSFAQGLYDDVMSDSSNVLDKDSKIAFLAMIIKLVGMQLNTIVEARPQKIVSGLEAPNTNRFLQLLALAATTLPDSSSNVRAVLESPEFAKNNATDDDDDNNNKNDDAVVRREESSRSMTTSDPSSHVQDNRSERNASVDEDDAPAVAAAKDDSRATVVTSSSSSFSERHAATESKNGDSIPLTQEDFSQPEEKRSARPVTAHRRPPKFKEKKDEAKDATAPVVVNKAKIIVDGAEGDDDDDDDKEQQEVEENDAAIADALKAEAKSQLAKDIQEEELKRIAKKKELEAKNTSVAPADGGIRFGKIDRAVAKEKTYVGETDVRGLQLAVQELCRSTNPLGKCMDYVREDLATMNRELEKWRDDYRDQLCAMDEEEKLSRAELKPLKAKLAELDEQIELEREQTRKVKNRITKQEERISFLLNATCTMSF